MLTIEGVYEVHDIHMVARRRSQCTSLHARIPDMHMDECERILSAIQAKAFRTSTSITPQSNSNAQDCRNLRLRHARTRQVNNVGPAF